jgi:hypothetical protein
MADIPPGLSGNPIHYSSGGLEGSKWRQLPTTTRHYTNAYVVQDGKVRRESIANRHVFPAISMCVGATWHEEEGLGPRKVRDGYHRSFIAEAQQVTSLKV